MNLLAFILANSWLDRLSDSLFAPSYNLRVIYLGVASLGIAAGVCGCFLLFRKRSLVSDTIGHSTLPGVTIAFLLVAKFGEGGKPFFPLMLGALMTGWLSMRTVQWVKQRTKTREDAALAIPLSAFYALGVVFLSIIQNLSLRESSGLEYYLFGMVASMVTAEAQTLLGVAIFSLSLIFLFYKELNCLCFDQGFVASQGLPNRWLDEALMLISLLITIAGLQTVGLLLIMALFIIPPATARLWTNSLPRTLIIAGSVGALGSLCGAMASATIPNLPAGASMIMAMSILFALSMLFGTRKGWLIRKVGLAKLENRLSENQFLRDLFDTLESQQKIRLLAGLEFSPDLAHVNVAMDRFLSKRAWTSTKQKRITENLYRQGLLVSKNLHEARLTEKGLERALETTRTHRLLELYLLEHAEVARSKVHQYVERIEEVTSPEIARDLRKLFAARLRKELIPTEPHT